MKHLRGFSHLYFLSYGLERVYCTVHVHVQQTQRARFMEQLFIVKGGVGFCLSILWIQFAFRLGLVWAALWLGTSPRGFYERPSQNLFNNILCLNCNRECMPVQNLRLSL